MKYNPEKHHRHSIRLQGYDYSKEGLYFFTICVYNRVCCFGEILDGQMWVNNMEEIANDFLMDIPEKHDTTQLHEYVVMPNHVHAIIELTVVGAIHESPLRSQKMEERQS